MKHDFTKTEIALWSVSTAAIVASFFLFDRGNYMTLAASIIGVTSLIFNAKGNPFGQLLMVIFSILYGIISFRFRSDGGVRPCFVAAKSLQGEQGGGCGQSAASA